MVGDVREMVVFKFTRCEVANDASTRDHVRTLSSIEECDSDVWVAESFRCTGRCQTNERLVANEGTAVHRLTDVHIVALRYAARVRPSEKSPADWQRFQTHTW
jgi:hypothetical protein